MQANLVSGCWSKQNLRAGLQKKKKKEHQEKQNKKQTLASTVNATEALQKKKKKNQDQDINKVTCFNYDKKGYYTSTFTKHPKN